MRYGVWIMRCRMKLLHHNREYQPYLKLAPPPDSRHCINGRHQNGTLVVAIVDGTLPNTLREYFSLVQYMVSRRLILSALANRVLNADILPSFIFSISKQHFQFLTTHFPYSRLTFGPNLLRTLSSSDRNVTRDGNFVRKHSCPEILYCQNQVSLRVGRLLFAQYLAAVAQSVLIITPQDQTFNPQSSS